MSCALGHVPFSSALFATSIFLSQFQMQESKKSSYNVMIMNNFIVRQEVENFYFTYIGFMYQVNFYSLCTLL